MSKALVPLSVIGHNICSGMGDTTSKYHYTITRHLLSGFRQLNLYVDQDFEVATAVLDYDNAVNMPCDFVFETKVGVQYNNRIAILTLDKSLGRIKLNQTDSEEAINTALSEDAIGLDCFPFYNAYYGSQYLGELYGYGRGVSAEGYYNLDRKNGVIYIGSLFPRDAKVVVEYKSSGIEDGLKLVPTEMEMCLSYWAKARFYEERRDYVSANYNHEQYKIHRYQIKGLYNFRSALYMSAEINQMFSPSNY